MVLTPKTPLDTPLRDNILYILYFIMSTILQDFVTLNSNFWNERHFTVDKKI